MSKTKKPQEVAEESETTENEFSEAEEVKFRGKSKNILEKVKKDLSEKQMDMSPDKKPLMARNVPVDLKYKNLKVRTFWTIVMLVLFIGIIAAGHIYCAALIFALNTAMVQEILSLKRNRERENEILFSVKLNYYFFAVAVFYFYGKLFSSVLAKFTLSSKIVSLVLVDYHEFISFALWVAGFLMFTLSLKKGFLRYQFRQFGWTHICVFLIVAQGTSMINNVYEGIIWFLLPALLVISNDTFAYLFGIAFGKTPLIQLSPKKTWEGFIGGSISTLFFAFIFSRFLSNFDYLICPQHDLTFKPFQFNTCQLPSIFVLSEYDVSSIPILNLFTDSMMISEFQFHALFLALFTSFVAPFGGFFASGFKRAIKVKDFADVIPGHGGITDRMDCQVLTGTFVYLYVNQIVKGRINYVNGVTRFIMNELDGADQLTLFNELQNTLITKGILNATLAVTS